MSPNQVHDYISRPVHWPDIVLSSNRVETTPTTASTSTGITDPVQAIRRSFMTKFPSWMTSTSSPLPTSSSTLLNNDEKYISMFPLAKGSTVKEYFALEQLCVMWECIETIPGKRLYVVSSDGVPGIAKDCVMDFEFSSLHNGDGTSDVDIALTTTAAAATKVVLTMEFTPQSPIAYMALPVLAVDNWIALNVLLPACVDVTPLNSYRILMGSLYGVAGILHLADLFLGGSQLFVKAGIPPYEELNPAGQAYALLWCAVGPLAWAFTKIREQEQISVPQKLNLADGGIVLYGLVEVFGAYFTGLSDVLVNAVGVQAIVLLAWGYSYNKQQQKINA